MDLNKIITGICSLLFLLVGAEKFLGFAETPCSLKAITSPYAWKLLGTLQILAGIFIWMPKYKNYVTGFFSLFMIFIVVVHLVNNTYDIGGAVFMGVLLSLLYWKPSLLQGEKT